MGPLQRWWFALLITGASLHAQNEPTVDVSLRLLLQQDIPAFSVSGEGVIPDQYRPSQTRYYYRSDEQYRPLALEGNVVSAAIRYSGPTPFVLYERRPSTVAGEADTYLPRMGCLLPTGAQGTYLLISQKPESGDVAALRLHPIALDTNAVPAGNVLLYNLGTRQLQVATSREKQSLPPNGSALFNISSGKNNQFKVMAAIGSEGAYTLVYRRNWFLSRDSRALCILYPINDDMSRWNSRMVPLD